MASTNISARFYKSTAVVHMRRWKGHGNTTETNGNFTIEKQKL